MVHVRLNEKETNPNPHFNFITALPMDPESQEEARHLLRALAAQVKPVMKQHGFAVNSLEEYEYNAVFAGRNWNNGETVELVLRRLDGSFYPNYWLMSTLCHELAHIKHMNHGPAFQSLWTRLRTEVRRLQDRGYYGDGYWSSGTRLRDSARVGGEGMATGEFPEYICGGAQSRQRPTATRRRRGPQGKRREVVPSLHTGAQTSKKKKAGGRVTSKYAFAGEGTTLANEGSGTGFGKKAASKRAREERALAAERRLLALQGGSEDTKPSASTSKAVEQTEDGDDTDDEVEFVSETDAERRQTLVESEKDANPQEKLASSNPWDRFKDEFNFGGASKPSSSTPPEEILDLSSDDDGEGPSCDVPLVSGLTSTTWASGGQSSSSHKGKNKATSTTSKQPLGLGKMVETEIELRKKESLGMAPVKGGGRKLGSKPRKQNSTIGDEIDTHPQPSQSGWSCQICTLENAPAHLSCSACATPRGQSTWPDNS